jgi:hypothetical protein
MKNQSKIPPLHRRGDLQKIIYKQIVNLRAKTLVYLTHKMVLPILKIIRKPIEFPYSLDNLKTMQKNTLGNDLFLFLQQKNLNLLPYYAKHDLKHILLQYDTTDEGEVCLQCFMLGNRHISFPVFITVLFGFLTMPEYWKNFIVAFKRGETSATIKHWNWFALLNEKTILLQQKINTK